MLECETERSFQSSHFLDLSEASTGKQGPDCRMVQNNHISNSMTRALDICDRRMENLIQHQQKEVQEFHKKMMEDKVKLEEEQRLELALICTKEDKVMLWMLWFLCCSSFFPHIYCHLWHVQLGCPI